MMTILRVTILLGLSVGWVAAVAPPAAVYIPYENSDGAYGQGSQANPAWRNVGASGPEAVHYIGSAAAATMPRTAPGGVAGDYLDISSYGDHSSDTMQTHNYYAPTGIVADVMSQAASLTCTFWIRDFYEDGAAAPSSYIWHQMGPPTTALKYLGDQNRIMINWNNQSGWVYSDWHSIEPQGNWVFVAVTVDTFSGAIAFYTGGKYTPVTYAGGATELTLSPLPSLSGTTSAHSFVMHGWAFNGLDPYAGYDMDEFRLYASGTDNSGALSLSVIEEIRQGDISAVCGGVEHPLPLSDLTGDCRVDMADYGRLGQAWMTDTVGGAVADAALRRYQVYEPTITRSLVVNAATDPLQHNNGPCIVHYRGEFYAIWYGNEAPTEAAPGQRIFCSTSPDAVNWTEPVSFTPSMPSGLQWQPGVINYNNDEALWCFWTHHFGTGVYFSRLQDPAQGWQHTNILGQVLHQGLLYNSFVSGNPIQLQNGRIIVPIILQEDGPAWIDRRKFATTIYTDDGGSHFYWNADALVAAPGSATGIWENTYVQQYDGSVRLFARNNDATVSTEALITAVGSANADSFAPAAFSATRTIRSRPGTHMAAGRYYMFHCDNPSIVSWREDRMNLALYCSRSGRDDFVAGVPIVDDEPTLVYPQGCVHDGKLYVIYCGIYDNLPLHVKVARVDPAPDAQTYYVFPRSANRKLTDSDPAVTEARIEHLTENGQDCLRFYGNAAAGLDIDALDSSADTLQLIVPVFVESGLAGQPLRLITVGNGEIVLAYDSATPDRLRLCLDGVWSDACSFVPDRWNKILLTVDAAGVVVRNGADTSVHPDAGGFSGRVYLGDGFPTQFLDASARFMVNVAQLATRVQSGTLDGTACGDASHAYPDADLNYDCKVDGKDLLLLTDTWLAESF